MNSCKLSIIIPYNNTREFMEECLTSVLRATEGIPSEILLVDDFSSDGSDEIARKFAEKHPSIHCLSSLKQTRGPGHARNVGLDQARGEYIACVDSDDLVKEDIYEQMITSIEYHDSEVCVCDVSRWRNNKELFSVAQNRGFSHIRLPVTSFKESPCLVFGFFCTNILVRRDYLESRHIRFPEDTLYEDFLYCFQVGTQAERISFIRNVEYLWRFRPVKNPSITQSYDDLQNFEDRMEMNRQTIAFAREEIKEEGILRALLTKILMIFPATILSTASEMEEEQLQYRIRRMREFAEEHIPEEALCQIPIIWEQVWRNILDDKIEEVKKGLLYQKNNYYLLPVERDGSNYSIVPNPDIISVDRRDIKLDFTYSIPVCHIRSVALSGHDLMLSGWIYYKRISVPEEQKQTVRSYLYHDITGKRQELQTRWCSARELTESEGGVVNHDDYTSHHYDYEGCGFTFSMNLQTVLVESAPGRHFIQLSYDNPMGSGERLLRGMHRSAIQKLSGIHLESETRELTISVDSRQTLHLIIREKDEVEILQKKIDDLMDVQSECNREIKVLKADKQSLQESVRRMEGERKSLTADLQRAEEKNEKLRQSLTFRVGRAILFIPRWIEKLFRH